MRDGRSATGGVAGPGDPYRGRVTAPGRGRHSSLLVQCLIYAGFGMPIGMLGAGWPEARTSYGATTGALGLVALGYGLGRLVTSPVALPILRRWHIRSANTVLALALAASCAAVALTRSFAVLVAAFAAIGLLTGTLDSLGNRYQTVVRDVGSAGLMFGSFCVGSTLGPAVVAVASWTAGYLAAAALLVAAAVLAASPGVSWPDALGRPEPPHGELSRVHVPGGVVALSLALFAIYCAIEVVTANWAASYLEGARGLDARTAAWAMSGFWAGMTVGRLSLGRLGVGGRGISSARLLTGAGAVVLAVFVAVPLLPSVAAAAALTLGGLALAVVFPTLMSTTADRVGVGATGRVMGWQLLTANLSATGMSLAVGIGVGRAGDAVPGVVLATMAVAGLPLLRRSTRVHATDEVTAAARPTTA